MVIAVFFFFPAQLLPLSRNEVSTYLIEFMVRTALALQELHEYGYSHVRIPNICLSNEKNPNGQYDVKLVDLNRYALISASVMEGYPGKMYHKSQQSWPMEKLDWKQLGTVFLQQRLSQNTR